MKSFASSIKRTLAALALVGMATTATLGSSAAHAGPRNVHPHISAMAITGRLVLDFSGTGFGAGDPVQLFGYENDDLSNPANLKLYAFLIASYGGNLAGDITDLSARCH